MKRYWAVLALAVGLTLVHGRGVVSPPVSPPDTTTHLIGSVQLSSRNHLYVRGHELSETVTATYRSGTGYLNGFTWHERIPIESVRSDFGMLTQYMTSPGPSIAIYTRSGSMLGGDREAERFLADIGKLEAAGWQLDSLKSTGLLSKGALREIAEQHGYRPRPRRTDTSLISFPPSNTGIVRPVWRVLAPLPYPITPALLDTAVCCMLRYGTLSVLDARTGMEIRSIPLPNLEMFENSASGDTLYLSLHDNRIIAMDLRTNRPLWSCPVDSKRRPFMCWTLTRPTVGDGRIYFGSQNGSVYAVERTVGIKVWEHKTGRAVAAPPVFSNGIVYVAGYAGKMDALDAGSGRPLWTCDLAEANENGPPVLIDSTLYVAGANGTVFAINSKLGTIHWSRKIGNRFAGRLAASDKLLLVADISGIYGLNRSDGRIVWKIPEAASNPVFGAGLVFCVTSSGQLLLIDPPTGTVIERHDVSGHCFNSSPLIQGDRVFVAAASDTCGVLTCFDLSPSNSRPN